MAKETHCSSAFTESLAANLPNEVGPRGYAMPRLSRLAIVTCPLLS
jgi:hypothetical protein